MKKNIFAFVFVLLLLQAQVGRAFELTDDQVNKIMQAENYINGITTFVADFIQISPYSTGGSSDTTMSYGTLSLSRPGKARWEYTAPTPMEIIINENKMIYYDRELDQVSYVDLEGGLSSFLTNEKVDLLHGAFEIVDFAEDEGGYNIVLQDVKGKDGERLITEQLRVTFVNDPFFLKRFNFKDVNGRITTVEFKNTSLGEKLDDELFVFKDPRIGRNVWEKK